MAVLIKTDGHSHMVKPQNEANGFTSEEVYNLLGCDIVECLTLTNGKLILVDEEGVYNHKEFNLVATNYANKHLHYPIEGLLGNALIVNNYEFR